MNKVPMTNNSFDLLEEELRTLKSEDRPNVIKAIAEAREHGDLSENAEYHAAKEQQSFIEGRILEIEDKLRRAEVINPSLIKSNKIVFGATINLFDENSNLEITFKIVGVDETNVEKGLISVSSPVARSLMGKSEGDIAEVITPGGKTTYEILKIEYK
jgi:transcription elongation factor GreA